MNDISWRENSFDDLVFEHRNKDYGAYYLRKVYDKYMSRGILTGLIFFLLFIFAPRIYAKFHEFIAKQDDKLALEVVKLVELPPVDHIPLPPPPRVDPPPIKDQVRFLPPRVMLDEEVRDEELPPSQDALKEVEISTTTQEGSEDGVDASLLEPQAPPSPPPPVVNDVEDPDENKVYDYYVVQKPEFPDGELAMKKFLKDNIHFPVLAKENGIMGRVVVKFVVTKTGEIENVQLIKGIGGGCDEEAIRVVKSMPQWKPGRYNGKPVNVSFILPVHFMLKN